MNHRRLVGIDLGIATAHTVRVLDGEGATVAKRKAWPTVESLAAVEEAALAGCPAGTRLEGPRSWAGTIRDGSLSGAPSAMNSWHSRVSMSQPEQSCTAEASRSWYGSGIVATGPGSC